MFAGLSNGTDSTFMLHWNGSRWTTQKFPDFTSMEAVAVLSQRDAWAFGATASGRPLVLQFNGSRWVRRQVSIIGFNVSARSPRNIWVSGNSPATGAAKIMHWNGRRWRKIALPNLHLPPGVVVGGIAILARGSRSLWAYAGFQKGQGVFPGQALLHWNGTAWRKVTVPFPTGETGLIISDGKGGLWLSAFSPSFTAYFYHDSGGRWSRQRVPAVAGNKTQVDALTHIPGTASAWAAGGLFPGDGSSQGVVLKEGP